MRLRGFNRANCTNAREETKLTLATFDTEVTIPLGHPCMGGGIAPAKEIVDPLFAYGFVLSGVGKPVVFLAARLVRNPQRRYDTFREKVAKAVDTDPVRVMLCALHQHDAPIVDVEAQQLLGKAKAKSAIADLAFFDKVVSRVADAAKACLKNADPITHIGTGEAKVEKGRLEPAIPRRGRQGALQPHVGDARREDPGRRRRHHRPAVEDAQFLERRHTVAWRFRLRDAPDEFLRQGWRNGRFHWLGACKRRQADTPGTVQMYASGCSGNVTAGKYNDGDPNNRPILADRTRNAMSVAWKATKKTAVKGASFRSVPLTLEARTSGRLFRRSRSRSD